MKQNHYPNPPKNRQFVICESEPQPAERIAPCSVSDGERAFLMLKNIDKCIDCAIEHTQNGGSPEMQTMLMHCKSETIGYTDPAAEFRL